MAMLEPKPELLEWFARHADDVPGARDAAWAAELLGGCPQGLLPSLDDLLTAFLCDALAQVQKPDEPLELRAVRERFEAVRGRATTAC
jgi:hypothetical protein